MTILRDIGLTIIIIILIGYFAIFATVAGFGGLLTGLSSKSSYANNQPSVLQRPMYEIMSPYPSANINSPYLTRFY